MAGNHTTRPPRRGWEHFEHVADVGVRGFGSSMARAFEQAALALSAVIADPATIRASETVEVSRQAPNAEILLVDWLNAVVFEMSSRRMLFSAYRVSIENCRLTATMAGEKVDTGRHRPAAEVKGATLSELKVEQDAQGRWTAQCIVDV